MNARLRRPAMTPPPIRPAVTRQDNPTEFLTRHYEQVWLTRMQDLPFTNAALSVQSTGFVNHAGDWLGVIVTPWFLNLFLLKGDGQLWTDVAAGERCHVQLPCGTLEFIADDDPDIGPYQYCPLIAPVSLLPDMATAWQAARDAMQAVLAPPPQPQSPPDSQVTAAHPELEPAPDASRRRFFRRVTGRG